MPQELLMLGGLVLAVWLIIIILKVPASVAFFSVLVGQLLSSEVSVEAYDFIGGLLHVGEFKYVQVALLVAPFILTLLFLKGRAPGSKLVFEIVPALFASAVLLLLVYPLVTWLQTIVEIGTYDQIERYRTIIIIAASVTVLVSTYLNYPKPHHEKHGKKH